MLKLKIKFNENKIKKKTKFKKIIKLNKGYIYKTYRTLINLEKLVKWLTKVYKRFKRRSIKLQFFFNNNTIRTFKSKNARMGKGKGAIIKSCSSHKQPIIGVSKDSSNLVKKNITKSLIKKI